MCIEEDPRKYTKEQVYKNLEEAHHRGKLEDIKKWFSLARYYDLLHTAQKYNAGQQRIQKMARKKDQDKKQ